MEERVKVSTKQNFRLNNYQPELQNQDFTSSLMSVGQTSDNDTVSIFTKTGVLVHKEDDVLITCKGKPILIGVRDERGRYRILLQQRQGTWKL